MDTKYIKMVVIFIFMTTISATCRKNCMDTNYSFAIYAQVYPDKDSIHVGDTLWLQINCPVDLQDKNGKIVNYRGAQNLGTVVSLLNLLPNGIDSGAMDNFDISFITGSDFNKSSDPFSNKVTVLDESQTSYELKMSFVAKKPGNYVLTISNASGVYTKYNKCSNAFFEIDFSSTNQHYYYLSLWRPELTLDEQGKTKVYYFKVY